MRDGSDPVLRCNVIRDSRRPGVFIHGDGRGTLEENQITGNQESGVRLGGGGRPTLRPLSARLLPAAFLGMVVLSAV